MEQSWNAVAEKCLSAAYEGTMDFPSIVRTLSDAGFEGYDVDYRRGTSTYFRTDGQSVLLQMPKTEGSVARDFNAGVIQQAVKAAQTQAPGYTYRGFCAQVKAAGCAGYMVSLLGRRVVYFGRTAEIHVEFMPK